MTTVKNILKFGALFVTSSLLSILVAHFDIHVRAEEDKPLRVHSLEIVDAKGVARLRLGAPTPDPMMGGKTSPRRSPMSGVQINDENGNEMGGLGMLNDGSQVFCFDSRNAEAVCMYSMPSGERGFSVSDNGGKDRTLMEIAADKSVSIKVNNEDGKTLAVIRVMDGKSEILLTTADGKTVWSSKK